MIKKKVLLFVGIGISAYLIFAAIVATAFRAISTNPINSAAISYIRNESSLENEYGEIIYVARNHNYKTEKSEARIKAAYEVETQTGDVFVYVTLMKSGEEWKGVSVETIKVKPSGE